MKPVLALLLSASVIGTVLVAMLVQWGPQSDAVPLASKVVPTSSTPQVGTSMHGPSDELGRREAEAHEASVAAGQGKVSAVETLVDPEVSFWESKYGGMDSRQLGVEAQTLASAIAAEMNKLSVEMFLDPEQVEERPDARITDEDAKGPLFTTRANGMDKSISRVYFDEAKYPDLYEMRREGYWLLGEAKRRGKVERAEGSGD